MIEIFFTIFMLTVLSVFILTWVAVMAGLIFETIVRFVNLVERGDTVEKIVALAAVGYLVIIMAVLS